jgi:hypothetical protein
LKEYIAVIVKRRSSGKKALTLENEASTFISKHRESIKLLLKVTTQKA